MRDKAEDILRACAELHERLARQSEFESYPNARLGGVKEGEAGAKE